MANRTVKGTWHLDDTQVADIDQVLEQKTAALKTELGEGEFKITEQTPRSVKWEYILPK